MGLLVVEEWSFLEDKMEAYRNWLFKKRNDSIKGVIKPLFVPMIKER